MTTTKRTWKRGQFSIKSCGEMTEPIEGYIRAVFGIHKVDRASFPYKVSHVPTGLRMFAAIKLALAKQFADTIEDRFGPEVFGLFERDAAGIVNAGDAEIGRQIRELCDSTPGITRK